MNTELLGSRSCDSASTRRCIPSKTVPFMASMAFRAASAASGPSKTTYAFMLSLASENWPFWAQTFRTRFWFPSWSTAVPATGIDRSRTFLTGAPNSPKIFRIALAFTDNGMFPTKIVVVSSSPSSPLPDRVVGLSSKLVGASFSAATALSFLRSFFGFRGFFRGRELAASLSSTAACRFSGIVDAEGGLGAGSSPSGFSASFAAFLALSFFPSFLFFPSNK
mmetsp:Transcript_10927/g.14435  ORF Transcript_10927/g.14435 Transcript_10927/m.14435 type:complete len:222 (+) Transcript_10927:923-1588(+)